jgi:hypothetical protein
MLISKKLTFLSDKLPSKKVKIKKLVSNFAKSHTVRSVPASTLIYITRVESSSAESNMLQVRHICTFLFSCFSNLNAPQMKHI